MKDVNKAELKNFLNKGLADETTRSVSDASAFLDVMRKQEVEPPTPYCLCHKIDLKPSMLETKHCRRKGCPHLVFVKEVWTASYPNKEATSSKRAMEVTMA